jgi:hypothetical protein
MFVGPKSKRRAPNSELKRSIVESLGSLSPLA